MIPVMTQTIQLATMLAMNQQHLKSSQNNPKQSSASDMVGKSGVYFGGRFLEQKVREVVSEEQARAGNRILYIYPISDSYAFQLLPFNLPETSTVDQCVQSGRESVRKTTMFRISSVIKLMNRGCPGLSPLFRNLGRGVGESETPFCP